MYCIKLLLFQKMWAIFTPCTQQTLVLMSCWGSCVLHKVFQNTSICYSGSLHFHFIWSPFAADSWNHVLTSPHWGRSFCVTLVWFGLSFKSFIALWAEEFDTTLWTANWQKRFSGTCFYSSAKFLYFHFVLHWTSCLKCFTILHVIFVHAIVYGAILFTELSVTFFCDPLQNYCRYFHC